MPIAPFPPAAAGAWRTLDREHRQEWLELAREHHFAAVHGLTPVAAGGTYTLDGSDIEDLTTFLCAIGEAINGPGGYFGACFQSFDDCLFGGFGLEAPCTFVWNHSSLSRQRLDAERLDAEPLFAALVDSIRSVPDRFVAERPGWVIDLVLA